MTETLGLPHLFHQQFPFCFFKPEAANFSTVNVVFNHRSHKKSYVIFFKLTKFHALLVWLLLISFFDFTNTVINPGIYLMLSLTDLIFLFF